MGKKSEGRASQAEELTCEKFSGVRGNEQSTYEKLMGSMTVKLKERELEGKCQDEDKQCLFHCLEDPSPSDYWFICLIF